MKQTIIYADVHLKTSEKGRHDYEDFLLFLRSIVPAETDRLICLGDLFDFWFEYRHVAFSGYFDVLRAFADLSDAGVALHLICGNHDFWAGAFLEKIGFQLHHEPVRVPFGDVEALLLHGDGLNPRDYGYRLFKRFARNPIAVRFFRHVHPDRAMAIAHAMSRGSRQLLKADVPAEGREARAIREHAHKLLARGDAAIVISGHAHAPLIEAVATPKGDGLYINPGDWPLHRSYITAIGREFTMHTFC